MKIMNMDDWFQLGYREGYDGRLISEEKLWELKWGFHTTSGVPIKEVIFNRDLIIEGWQEGFATWHNEQLGEE